MIELANLARKVAGAGAIRLDSTDLRAALHSHWESLKKEAEPQTRVATMNLLLGVSHPEDCLGLAELLDPLSHSHPGRMVVFVFDSETHEASIEGWFNSTCMQQHPERICSERIVIYCPGSPARVPSLVLPLTVPGLPVFHWWRGEPPFGSDLLERLVEASDRVIFDSNRFSLASGMSRMSRLINDPYHTEQAFSDLSWGRAQLAREKVAALFDGQAGLAALDTIAEVTIAGPGERPGPSGLLLAGWLASRLGWKVVNPLRAEGRTWMGDLIHQGRGIRLRLAGGRDSGWQVAFGPGLVTEAPPLKGAELMGREFDIQGRDRVFEEALESALVITGEKEARTNGSSR